MVRSPSTAALPEALARVLASQGVREEQLEASVRRVADGSLRGERVMIERAPAALLEPLARALGVPVGAPARALAAAASSAGLPLILGWDAGALKVYLNASDASSPLRRALWERVAWPELRALEREPHLLALNADARGSERKAYVQYATAEEGARGRGEGALELARRTLRAGLDAGSVVSWDLSPSGCVARACFVALRSDRSPEPLLASLPGWSAAGVEALLPFARGGCRSVGVPAGSSDAGRWTAYFKPRGMNSALHNLEPAGSFLAGESELALFLAPSSSEARAFARVGRFALSYRVVRGAPSREDALALMQWAVERLREAEREGPTAEPRFASPPRPWVLSG